MIVYGHHAYRLNVPAYVADLCTRLDALPVNPTRDALTELLIDVGELYTAVADALAPLRDDDLDAIRPWCDMLHSAAAALAASVAGDARGVRRAVLRCRQRAGVASATAFVRDVPGRTSEGFAHYSLYPEQYLAAAEQFCDAQRPRRVVCIGIRTIGATLACVVGAALERRGVDVSVHTVRPRGHPFDRTIAVTEQLRARICADNPSHYAIVDEGPGISGSSFAAVSDTLLELGASADRIVLFPSWHAPAGALRSERGRLAWQRHARFVAPFEDVFVLNHEDDVSAGRWRPVVYGDRLRAWPAVHPQHERRKFLQHTPAGDLLSRFAGLGRYGRAKLERARALADAKFTPAPIALTHGFLTTQWAAGRPLDRGCGGGEVTARLAEYVAFVGRQFPTGRRAAVGDLVEMIRVNAAEGLGPDRADAVIAFAADASGFDEPEIALDGRMLPHEWIATADGLLKVDALDHHADDFLPGARDIAWDVAGAIAEFGFEPPRAAHFVDRYRARSGDRTIASRLPFYHAAYLAYRLGYATMAADALGRSLDALRFRRLAGQYRRSLERLVRSNR